MVFRTSGLFSGLRSTDFGLPSSGLPVFLTFGLTRLPVINTLVIKEIDDSLGDDSFVISGLVIKAIDDSQSDDNCKNLYAA